MKNTHFKLVEGFPGGSVGKKNPPAMWETWVQSWVGMISWRRQELATPVFCLENSMDREAWEATVHGAAKSPT